MKRRTFLERLSATAAIPCVSGSLLRETVRGEGDMPYRPLGRTGERVSLLGLGGYHIGMPKDESVGIALIRTAIDSGINFLDNCWDYHNGESEVRMGKALRDGYRAKAFLMSKIDGRTKKVAADQIDQSLKRLQTDVIDLMQHHEIIRLEDPDRIFADGGAHEAMIEARKAGKIRFIGFTGHKDPIVHLRMLETARRHDFRFDAVQMPLNVLDAHFRSFAQQVVPVLAEQGIGILGMKSMASGMALQTRTVTPVECLHYAMSLPTSTVISGMESLDLLQKNIETARSFVPLTQDQIQALVARTGDVASRGKFERFKTTHDFDGTAQNPKWMGP